MEKKLKEIFNTNNVLFWNKPKITDRFKEIFSSFNEFKGTNDLSNMISNIDKEYKFGEIESLFLFMFKSELKRIDEEYLWNRTTELNYNQVIEFLTNRKNIFVQEHIILCMQ